MKRYAKMDFTGPSTSCLATTSWALPSTANNKSLHVVKIEDENGKLNYVSVSPSSANSDISVIKLNGKFGQLLGLKDGQNVVVTQVEHNLPSVESMDVTCDSADDWEILEANAEALTNKLLNQLRIVYCGLRFPIWVSKSLSIHLRVEKLKPQVEVGVLESFSEVIVPSISSVKKNPFNLNFSPRFRIHPLTLLPDLKLNTNSFLLLNNVDHAFIYRSSLMPQDNSSSSLNTNDETQGSFCAKLAHNFESSSADERLFPNVKIYFIEYIADKEIELYDMLQNLNPPAIFVHPNLIKEFHLILKSHVFIEQVSNNVSAQSIPRYSSLSTTTALNQESINYCRIFQKESEEAGIFLMAALGLTSRHGMYGPACGLMLVTGKDGSGKTTFAQSLAIELEGFPFYVHWEQISCAKLRGKKTETVQKEFDAVAKRSLDLYPSIIILDDLDIICPPVMAEQHNPQEEFLHYRTCETIFECIMTLTGKQIAVICTARAESSLHMYWRSREGTHVFQHCVHLPAPNPLERLGIFRACLRRYQSRAETVTLGSDTSTASSSSPAQVNSLMTVVTPTRAAVTTTSSQVGFSQGNFNTLPVPLISKSYTSNQEIQLTDSIQNALFNLHDTVCSPNTLHSIAKKWALCVNKDSFNCSTVEDRNDFFREIIQNEVGLRDAAASKSKTIKPITWDQIGGLTKVKKELTKILQWPIKYSKLFDKSPIKMPSGILLYGFPGTGKTLLGLSMTSLVTNTKFIHIKGPELLSKYIGASEQAVQDLFRKAKDSSPCILFFDEFDSLVPRRGHDSTGVTDRVVNQFLAEMDGIEGGLGKGVYLIGATSRPDLIDPAVLRPGRLDKHLFFPMPDEGERVDIISALSGDVQYSETGGEILWDEIGRETGGFTGADLHSLLCTAQLEAIQESLASILNHATSKDSESTAKDLNAQELEAGAPVKIPVTQAHIRNALKTFKPSLPAQEFNKFKTIYDNFASLTKEGGGDTSDANVSSVLIEHGKIATLA